MVLGLSYGELFVTLGVISVILGALYLVSMHVFACSQPEEEPEHSKLVAAFFV